MPAYNEEKVISRTIHSVLNSNYPNLRVVVIDDGSSDRTYEVAREEFADAIARGRVTVLRQENGGKARALNYGLQFVTEEIFVGIDADTLIATMRSPTWYLTSRMRDWAPWRATPRWAIE